MAFTLKDMENQQAEFEQIKEEFSKLNQRHEIFLKENNIKDEDLVLDIHSLSQEDQKLVELAKTECEKNTSKAQTKAASESKVSHRRNVLRA